MKKVSADPIYCKDHGVNIERIPVRIEYIFEGEKHYYFPDFVVNGKLVEIKGSQFVNADGTWSNPFDSSRDYLLETKYQLLLKNNVEIIYQNDILKYVDYVLSKYGQDFLNQCKTDIAH